jgi:hypothetical protein
MSDPSPEQLEDHEISQSMFVYGLASGVIESPYELELKMRTVSYDQRSDTLRSTLEKFKK